MHCRLSLRASFRWRVLHSINSNIRLGFSWCTRSIIKVAKEERTIAMPITVTEPCIGKWTMFVLSSVASFVSMRGEANALPSSPWTWLSNSDDTRTWNCFEARLQRKMSPCQWSFLSQRSMIRSLFTQFLFIGLELSYALSLPCSLLSAALQNSLAASEDHALHHPLAPILNLSSRSKARAEHLRVVVCFEIHSVYLWALV